jgi:hypothetical protein
MKNVKIDRDIVLKLTEEGKTPLEIAQYFQCKRSSVYNFCKRNGIKHNGPGRESAGGKNLIDITGNIFGSLTVISKNETKDDVKNTCAYWNCLCECGKTTVSHSRDLRSGKIKTCGCSKKNARPKARVYEGCSEHISYRMWSRIHRNAISRDIDVLISLEYVGELMLKQNFKCSLTGMEISANKRICTASLDRIDSSKGYIEGNVQWVHKDVNMMKQSYIQEYFIELCRLVVKKNDKKY